MSAMISRSLLEKIQSNTSEGNFITQEDLAYESQRLGITKLDVIDQLFDFLIEYRLTSKGY